MATDSANQTELLKRAVEHARHGDARGYVAGLLESHALDGITRNLEGRWPQADGSVIETVVAEATDALYEALVDGRKIAVPAGFLWRTAHYKLLNRHRAGLVVRETFDESSEEHNRVVESQIEAPDREAMRREAVRFARSVLPSLGQTTVVQVMSVIIDCVEQGDLYIDNQFIADTLGLTKDTVRKAKHRGFQRLKREAKKHGVEFEDDLADIGQEDGEA